MNTSDVDNTTFDRTTTKQCIYMWSTDILATLFLGCFNYFKQEYFCEFIFVIWVRSLFKSLRRFDENTLHY